MEENRGPLGVASAPARPGARSSIVLGPAPGRGGHAHAHRGRICRDMKIWVDADACPVVIREILFRAAMRTGVKVTLVANQHFRVPASPLVELVQVDSGFDVADNEIVKRAGSGDLVITADIPLAAEVMGNGAHALSPRGERYSTDTIRQRLNMRDFMDTLRASGIHTGGPPALSKSDRQSFANHLDRLLTRYEKG